MSQEIKELLLLAYDELKKGNYKGHQLFKRTLDENLEGYGEIVFDISALLFSLNMYEAALEGFIKCYSIGYKPDEVLGIIMEAYHDPNIEDYEQRYNRNVDMLSRYKHIYSKHFLEFSELDYCFIPFSDTKYAVFSRKENRFLHIYDLKLKRYDTSAYKQKDVVIVKNEYSINIILDCINMTKDSEPFLWMKDPFYLYYDKYEDFLQYLQISDFTQVLLTERVVLLFSENELSTWFSDSQSVLPIHLSNLSGQGDKLMTFISSVYSSREDEYKSCLININNHYNNFSKIELIQNLKKGKVKILFITTRFSTAIQYIIKDCINACNKMNIENRLLIEKSDIHRLASFAWIKEISSYKPDIIFIIDHFRWEYEFLNENIPFVNWVQDALPNIMSKESPKKIKAMDIIINPWMTGKEFFSIGYPNENIIEKGIVPINNELYKTYKLTNEEIQKYSADICIVSNPGNPQIGLSNVLGSFKRHEKYRIIEKAITSAYKEAYRTVYNGEPFYAIEQHTDLIKRWLESCGLNIDETGLKMISEIFRQEIIWRIFRSVPVEWLAEKGYNIKLWGMEWVNHPRLHEYAMGVAQNGETLSRILNATKICVGTQPAATTHPRVYESMLSNCFYFANNVPEEYDWANVRELLEEDKEIVFYYGKEDLYNKVDYFLENEVARKDIVERGKKKIIDTLTYDAFMKRVMDGAAVIISKYIETDKKM